MEVAWFYYLIVLGVVACMANFYAVIEARSIGAYLGRMISLFLNLIFVAGAIAFMP